MRDHCCGLVGSEGVGDLAAYGVAAGGIGEVEGCTSRQNVVTSSRTSVLSSPTLRAIQSAAARAGAASQPLDWDAVEVDHLPDAVREVEQRAELSPWPHPDQ